MTLWPRRPLSLLVAPSTPLLDACRRRLLIFGLLVIGFFALTLGWPALAAAQDDPELAASAEDTAEVEPIVTRIRFRGGEAFRHTTLEARVHTRHNRHFMGVRGLTWWLWLYRLGESEALGERIGQALMASGEPPAYLDRSVVETDAERLQMLYQQEGYREASVEPEIQRYDEGRRAVVVFNIDPGEPTHLRRVAYDGLDTLDASTREQLVEESLIPGADEHDEALTFRAEEQRYSEPLLLEERRRLVSFLRNEGYARVTRDSLRALVETPSPDSFDVTFRVQPGPRYRFGDVHVQVTGPEADAETRSDTLVLDESEANNPPVMIVEMEQESRLHPRLMRRALRFAPGDWYNLSEVLDTKRRLEATGVFALTDITAMSPEESDDDEPPRLPHRIQLHTQSRHQVRFETFALQRTGALGALESELGTGVGISYNNVNLLGGGEALRVGLSGSVAGDLGARVVTTSQAEVSTSLTFPYLMRPFASLDRGLGLYDARTQLSLSMLSLWSPELRFVVRGRGATRLRLEMQHSPTVTSLVDAPDISFSNPDTLAGFRRDVLDRLLGPEDEPLVTDPVQRAQLLEDYTQRQLNSALRYSLRAARVNPLHREEGFSYELVGEMGGHLPYLLDHVAWSPDTISGRIPIGGGDGLIYRPYVRFLADLRQYRPISRNTTLAARFLGGFAHPTGPASVVPFDRRFYSGGASSVRGWRLRELGPGSVRTFGEDEAARTGETNLFGGDIKLEASLELRRPFIRNFLAADWLGVLFADAGNVWFGPRNPGFSSEVPDLPDGNFRLGKVLDEIAVGSGIGMRLSWEYLVARLDLAYRVRDPADPSLGILPEGLSGPLFGKRPMFHFGIGHTF